MINAAEFHFCEHVWCVRHSWCINTCFLTYIFHTYHNFHFKEYENWGSEKFHTLPAARFQERSRNPNTASGLTTSSTQPQSERLVSGSRAASGFDWALHWVPGNCYHTSFVWGGRNCKTFEVYLLSLHFFPNIPKSDFVFLPKDLESIFLSLKLSSCLLGCVSESIVFCLSSHVRCGSF